MKIKNQIYIALYCYCGGNASSKDFFQNTGFKESNNMASND